MKAPLCIKQRLLFDLCSLGQQLRHNGMVLASEARDPRFDVQFGLFCRDDSGNCCAQATKERSPGFETHGQQSHPKSKTNSTSDPTKLILIQQNVAKRR